MNKTVITEKGQSIFLQKFLDKVYEEDEAVFLYHYSGKDSFKKITYKDISSHLSKRVPILIEQLHQGQLLFLIHNDVGEQILWWLSALISGVTPGILTPLTPKLDQNKYFTDLKEILSAYENIKILVDKNIVHTKYLDIIPDNFLVKYSDSIHSKPEMTCQQFEQRYSSGSLIFQQSSGTTSVRKGMILDEKSVINQLEAYKQAIKLDENDVIVSWLPLYHDMGLVACLMQAVYWTIPLVITSPFVWLGDPAWIFKATSEHKGTLCWLPNFALNFLSSRVPAEQFRPDTLRTMRAIINCSETVIASSIKRFYDKFSSIGLSLEAVSSSYAMAENIFAVTQTDLNKGVVFEAIDKQQLQNEQRAVIKQDGYEVVSSGLPITNVEIRIVSQDKQLPDGYVGEILIRSNCLIKDYFGIGQSKRVRDDDGWFATGDIGYLRNNHLFVIGRKKDIIIHAGRNINPTDIEDVVSNIDGIKSGRVVAFGDYNDQEGTEDVVVIAEFGANKVSDVNKIRKNVFEVVNRTMDIAVQKVEIIRSGWLIKSSSGKISRKGCREKYQKMKECRKIPEIIITEYRNNIDEAQADAFMYFGRESKIITPTEIFVPSRIHIGNWVTLDKHGQIIMQTDFSKRKEYALQHYPEVKHNYDPIIYGKRSPILKIGDGTSIGPRFFISCVRYIEIGKHVLISNNVFISDSNHLYDNPDLPIGLQSNTLGKPVVIGDHSWIGINVVILEGVKIGKHSIISSNSVVVQDVPDYVVVAGNPARIVKSLKSGYKEESVRSGIKIKNERSVINGVSLTNPLIEYFRNEMNIDLSENESLFKSGLVDSLGVLKLIVFIEKRLGFLINDYDFVNKNFDTINDIVNYLVEQF